MQPISVQNKTFYYPEYKTQRNTINTKIEII